MSKGFVSEYEDQWLHEIMPTMNALLRFLKQESNGVKIHEERNYLHPDTGKPVYEMSNGLSYSLNSQNQWYVLDYDNLPQILSHFTVPNVTFAPATQYVSACSFQIISSYGLF